MIEELPARGLACRFTHELVRRALYDRLTGPRRAELHLRVGEALEAGGARSGRALADLAHHFAAAAPFGPAGARSSTTCCAARAADRALAFDEAAARLRTALELGSTDRSRRRGPARAGDASHRARQGARRARRLHAPRPRSPASCGDAELLARAAIGYEDACWRPGHGRPGRGRAARGGGGRAR